MATLSSPGTQLRAYRVSVRTTSGSPAIDALIAATNQNRPGEEGLQRLVRQVLRSTLEQRRSRHD